MKKDLRHGKLIYKWRHEKRVHIPSGYEYMLLMDVAFVVFYALYT